VRADVHHWDAVMRTWQRTRPQRLWRQHSDIVTEAMLERWLPHTRIERLLKTDLFDEAVHTGLCPMLARRARQVIGIDLSTRVAKAAGRPLALASDVTSLPFCDGIFDVVVSNSTLDHFDSTDQIRVALDEIHRVIRPGGVLVLTLDNLSNPLIALRNRLPPHWIRRIGLVPYQVGATLGPQAVARMLDEVGFDLEQEDTLIHCPRFLAVALLRMVEARRLRTVDQYLLRGLMAFERLKAWPTRFCTGHYVAVRAVRRRML